MPEKQWISCSIIDENDAGFAYSNQSFAQKLASFMNEKNLRPGELILVNSETLEVCYWGVPEATEKE